jgi:hypothetical protein
MDIGPSPAIRAALASLNQSRPAQQAEAASVRRAPATEAAEGANRQSTRSRGDAPPDSRANAAPPPPRADQRAQRLGQHVDLLV